MDNSRCCFEIDPQLFPKTAVPGKEIKAISTLKERLFGESRSSERHPCKCK